MRRSLLAVLILCVATGAAQTVIFRDSMNNFPTGWTLQVLSGSTNWTRMSNRYHSASYSAKCSNAATYYNANQHNIFKRAVNLLGYGAGELSFWCWCQTENGYDSVVLEYHATGGDWLRLWQRTGIPAVWESLDVVIPGNADSIRFRFRADGQVQYEGVYIDDVVLTAIATDVGVTSIVAPTGTVDTGTWLNPACMVRNYSPIPLSYWVACRIGSSWSDSTLVTAHPRSSEIRVNFPPWNAAPRGKLVVRCSTRLAFDAQRGNDAATDSTWVRVHDATCLAIVAPSGDDLDSGYGITPQALVKNQGTEFETFSVLMRIGSFYTDSKLVSLPPGGVVSLSFASRPVTAPRGPVTARCTTLLSTDHARVNDAAGRIYTVRAHDVGATAISSPGPSVDSGDLVTPRASVTNYGNATEEFVCTFRIGSVYSDTVVTTLSPGDARELTFASWMAVPGSFRASCSTGLGTDLLHGNDAVSQSLFVRLLDAGVTRILSPHLLIQPGSVTPRVEVRNWGNTSAANCAVNLSISPGGYSSTVIRTVTAGKTDTFTFQSWTATLGSYQATAILTLAGDMNPANDTLRKNVTVDGVHHDLGVEEILNPAAQIDPGNVAPVVRVFNYGSSTETGVPVVMSVDLAADLVFADTQTISSIAPGEERDVTFRNWLAYTGNFTVKSWTRLSTDENRANDTCTKSVLVALHSVSMVDIVAPASQIGVGYPLIPRVLVRNSGSVVDSFPVRMTISYQSVPVYRDSSRCRLSPRETACVSLPRWTPSQTGTYHLETWTALPGDYNPADDTIKDDFAVIDAAVDAGAVRVDVPSGFVSPGVVSPSVRVTNLGNTQASFWTRLQIVLDKDTVYAESAWVGMLDPGDTLAVSLPDWGAPTGTFTLVLSVRCQGDANPNNDIVYSGVVVRSQGRWSEQPSLPLLLSGRAIGKGAGLAAIPGSGRLYALKGNGTPDFYSYSVADTTWDSLRPMPLGREAKKPKDGAALASDGARYVFATKGNNTSGFWLYDTRADTWHQLRDVPLGPSNKRVKGGTSLAYALRGETACVYLLKGYRNEFYRYNLEADSWAALDQAPVGASVKWDKGSWLAGPTGGCLFAHKAKYHEFYRYELGADSWLTAKLTPMPIPGSAGSKKAKEGSCAATADPLIYALKGGNTQEFWLYLTGSDIWVELETLPRAGSSLKGKRVKAGASLAWLPPHVWAFKGNKTREFWRYSPTAALGARLPAGVQAESWSAAGAELAAFPNPARQGEGITFAFSWPGTEEALLSLYDAAGRRVLLTPVRSSPFGLSTRSLARGVYFCRLSAGRAAFTRKLVIE